MGGSTALKLSFKIPDSIDKIILLSPAGLFGEPMSIPFPLNQIGASFLGLQNCGHLPHVDLPSLSSKIIQDYFLE